MDCQPESDYLLPTRKGTKVATSHLRHAALPGNGQHPNGPEGPRALGFVRHDGLHARRGRRTGRDNEGPLIGDVPVNKAVYRIYVLFTGRKRHFSSQGGFVGRGNGEISHADIRREPFCIQTAPSWKTILSRQYF